MIPDRDDDEEGEDDQAHVEGLQFLAERDMRSLHRVSVRAANDPSVFTITRPSLMTFTSASQFPYLVGVFITVSSSKLRRSSVVL